MAKGKRLRLRDFLRYVKENGRWAQAVYDEIEEIQYQFNDLYATELARWQEQLGTCISMIIQDQEGLPPHLAKLVAEHRDKARREVLEEIAELERQVAEHRATADRLLAEAQAELAELRKVNPMLNEREEKLKAQLVSLADEIAALGDQIEQLSRGILGGIKNARRLRRLRRKRKALRLRQEAANRELVDVRMEWQKKRKEAEEEQTRLRQAWQQATVTASQLQARLDYLTNNLEEVSLRRGVEEMLKNMEKSPVEDGELGEALQTMVELNTTKKAYEKGLTSVAEMLGLLKGIREGLQRFQQSVGKVYEEQERYNLKPLAVDLSSRVIKFHQSWKELRGLVKDEKYLGRHPLEFSERVDEFRRKRFTDEAVEGMFEDMGKALTRATKQWG